MKAYGNFENRVDKVLQSYFNACAIRMSCVDLARAFVYLANRASLLASTPCCQPGPPSGSMPCSPPAASMTGGRLRLPGRHAGEIRGGGGIMALIPGELSICVWSPELNKAGNSLAGTAALELLAERLGRSIFNSLHYASRRHHETE